VSGLPGPLPGMALVAGLFTLAIIGVGTARRFGLLSAEVARKSVHVQLGLIIAAFPWLFTALWPAWCLAGLSLVVLALMRWTPWLRGRVGGSLHDVQRVSWGDFCFPIAAAVVWTLAPGDWLRFSLPMVILAVSDAVAALIGSSYGRLRYTAAGGHKSWEGSFAFFLVTLLVVHVGLLLGTSVGRAESLLIATNVALLLTLVEALAWEGFDNLFIPIAGVFTINNSLSLGLGALGERSAALLLLTVGCWWWRRRTTLDDAAVLACAVLGFELWTVCSWRWLVAPATLFAVYSALYPPKDGLRAHRTVVPFTIMLPGLVWALVHARMPSDPRWLLAATCTYAIHLAMISLLWKARRWPQASWPGLMAASWLVGVLAVVVPTALLIGRSAWVGSVVSAGGVLLGLLVAWGCLPDRRQLPGHERRWLTGCLAALAGSALLILVRP